MIDKKELESFGEFDSSRDDESVSEATHEAITGNEKVDSRTVSVSDISQRGASVRAQLMARLGEEVFKSWFGAMDFQSFDGSVLKVSVPVKFLKNWIQTHYSQILLECAASAFKGVDRVEVLLRQPGGTAARTQVQPQLRPRGDLDAVAETRKTTPIRQAMTAGLAPRTQVNGLEGSIRGVALAIVCSVMNSWNTFFSRPTCDSKPV